MLLKKTVTYGFLLGLPLSILYAWSTVNGHPFGTAAHTAIYTASVYPSGFAYVSAICLLYLHGREWRLWRCLAAPGRMALTNYVGQSVWGMVLFYGIGFGLGAGMVDRNRIHSFLRLSCPDGIQCPMALLFPLWASGMGLADADLWEMAKNKEIK